jgi:hypothetical protein
MQSEITGLRPTKKCTTCLLEKPLESFSKQRSTKDGLKYSCKTCHRKKSAEHRLKGWERIFEFFGGRKCQRCGLESDYPIYEVHHKNPNDKDKKHVGGRGLSKETLEAELIKCELLCANCHKIRHHELRQKNE